MLNVLVLYSQFYNPYLDLCILHHFNDIIVYNYFVNLQVAVKNEKRSKGSATHVAEFDVVMQVMFVTKSIFHLVKQFFLPQHQYMNLTWMRITII